MHGHLLQLGYRDSTPRMAVRGIYAPGSTGSGRKDAEGNVVPTQLGFPYCSRTLFFKEIVLPTTTTMMVAGDFNSTRDPDLDARR